MTLPPTNPNNCSTCGYEKDPQGTGYCYMWKDAPTFVCHQHTLRRIGPSSFRLPTVTPDPAKGASE